MYLSDVLKSQVGSCQQS